MSGHDDIAPTGLGRLYRGQTAIDFYGRRKYGLIAAVAVVVITIVSLFAQGLNLGLDFEGGQAWDVPSGPTFGVDEAKQVLEDNGVSASGAKLQLRSSDTRSVVAIQIEVVPSDQADKITADFAEASGSTVDEVNFAFTSSSWGSDITRSAARALIVFVIAVTLFISVRFEWRMAVAAMAATAHDVMFAVGFYSVFRIEVTPATVIAFLTILGYSLYDTIVVFDRVKENEAKYSSVRMPYPDIVNISMNQVLMRSINTTLSSILPVMSLLFIGAGILGATTLQEFAVALLVGMISGIYSSIAIASPLLAKLRANTGRKLHRELLTGEALRAAVIGSGVTGRLSESPVGRDTMVGSDRTVDKKVDVERTAALHQPAERILTHPPRPRKKKRR